MPDDFLDFKHAIYVSHESAWHRDERRLYGGDAVLTELVQWKGEETTFFTARKNQASYLILPKLHAVTLTGHLSSETPVPDFGQLGKVRERKGVDTPSMAELLWYNVDGIGQDGSEMRAWFDGVQERALATGFRWIMVEAPTIATLTEIRIARGDRATVGPNTVITQQDVLDGFRPFAVEYSPLKVWNWQFTHGRLDFAVIRVTLPQANLLDTSKAGQEGYYLLVRKGFTGLGDLWASGGWWIFNDQKAQQGHGLWDRTKGQIPFFPFFGETSPGTTERPSLARSLTMELGQIAVGLMNRRSERDYNISQAAKSINWVLGIGKDEHALTVEQHESGSIVVGVPPVMLQDGTVGIPTMWNSSAAALDAGAFASVIDAAMSEAREIMVRQVTSTPDSSGRSKEAGFAEATSPLLARLAATRQQAINTFLYFAALRFGIDEPRAVVTIPREFDLEPLVTQIDDQLRTLKSSWLRSPTLEADLVIRAADERGLMPEDKAKRAQIEAELAESGKVPAEDAMAQQFSQ